MSGASSHGGGRIAIDIVPLAILVDRGKQPRLALTLGFLANEHRF